MSEASFQRSISIAKPVRPARPAPLGYGLLAAAGVSVGLWAVLIWGVSRILA